MTHAIIYDRASTKNQKDNYSRVNAYEVGVRIAEQNGFTWEYVKEIGSGTTLTGRPEMMRILDRIAAKEIQAIIVQDLDRLARPEESVVYTTIRQVIMQYNVIIYTHTSRVDLNNDDDDFVADITMSVAKKERRRILKRMKRSRQARAEQGHYAGGNVGLGYKLILKGKTTDYAIDDTEALTVKAVFNILETTGGNVGATSKRLNELGYTGKEGCQFGPFSVHRIAKRKIYIGVLESAVTDKVNYRPDLQIISVDQFERVQQLIKSRKVDPKKMGQRGRYIFTGFVICANCGGAMVAGNNSIGVVYQCATRRKYGEAGCSAGKTYNERLILPPIIDFLAGFIQEQIDFYTALDDAAAVYGKSVTEEAVEAAIQGELASVQAGKNRLIEAISLGVLSTQEAAVKLAELREQEQRLTIELSSIAEKTAIMAQWQEALDALKGRDITKRLFDLAEQKPIAFRRLLSLVFEPNSLRVRTWREGRKWVGALDDYKLTESMSKVTISTGNKIGKMV